MSDSADRLIALVEHVSDKPLGRQIGKRLMAAALREGADICMVGYGDADALTCYKRLRALALELEGKKEDDG